jgi:tetratricopeptide (TPR) repeat protein
MMRWLKQLFDRRSLQERADELMERGLAYVEADRTSEALAVADELYSLRYSGGFEIEALALARKGSKEDAVAVLRKGLQIAPQSWLTGNLLGNYLSDLGRFDEAFAAYENALRIPAADRTVVEANYTLALQRAGRNEAARAKLQEFIDRDILTAESSVQELVRALSNDLQV